MTTYSAVERNVLLAVATAAVFFTGAVVAQAAPPQSCDEDATTVPGHCAKDSGTVVGNYDAVYAYDAEGDWYQDYGDGRDAIESVDSIEELDQETLTVCDYKVHYKGDSGDDPFLNMGVIQNMINCFGMKIRHLQLNYR